MPRSATLLLVLGAAAACGGTGAAAPDAGATDGGGCAFPAQPFQTVSSASGQLSIELRSCPVQPPTAGENTIEYTITDASGAPQDGLTLGIVPWMPAMDHGTSAKPIITDQGDGVYVVQNVYLFMSGEWQLQTSISGPLTDSATPTIQIQ
ncbi:MAG TPA: FixH family protein [Myxococcales bacterium]|nr:FixH family protein [Myxococcales bacterium]